MTSVLIVEDEAPIRKFAAVNLAARGYKVFEAPDAETGIECLRDLLPAVVLLDIQLPGKSGWDLLAELEADPRLAGTRVVVMTASAASTVREALADHPSIVEVLSKPASVSQLLHAIQRAEARSSGTASGEPEHSICA